MNSVKSYITDINTYLPLIPVFAGILLKLTLDINLGKWWVKYFYWVSLRSIFRTKTNKISGIYKQYWNIENNNRYKNVSDRQSLITLKQLNNYCYGEFYARNGEEKYHFFGEIIDRKIIGHWQNHKSTLGYFGSFELTIVDNKKIKGFWMGHSHENPVNINMHEWTFTAITNTTKCLVPAQIAVWNKRRKKRKILRQKPKTTTSQRG